MDDWTWKIQNLFREKSSTPAPKHANVKDWVWQMQKGQTRKANQSKLCEGSRSVICHMLHVTCIYWIITLTEKMMGHNHFDDQFMSKLSITSTSWPNCWVEYKVEYKIVEWSIKWSIDFDIPLIFCCGNSIVYRNSKLWKIIIWLLCIINCFCLWYSIIWWYCIIFVWKKLWLSIIWFYDDFPSYDDYAS